MAGHAFPGPAATRARSPPHLSAGRGRMLHAEPQRAVTREGSGGGANRGPLHTPWGPRRRRGADPQAGGVGGGGGALGCSGQAGPTQGECLHTAGLHSPHAQNSPSLTLWGTPSATQSGLFPAEETSEQERHRPPTMELVRLFPYAAEYGIPTTGTLRPGNAQGRAHTSTHKPAHSCLHQSQKVGTSPSPHGKQISTVRCIHTTERYQP